MANKKVARAKKIKLKEGDYFTANYQRRKIRGVVFEVNRSEFFLLNKTEGDDSEDCWGLDSTEYAKAISVEIDTFDDHFDPIDESKYDYEQALKDAGVTNYQVVTDRRIKALIDRDKTPKFGDHAIKFTKEKNKNDDRFEFGCGAVVLTRKEIEVFLKLKQTFTESELDKMFQGFSDIEEAGEVNLLYDAEIESIEELLKAY